MGVPPLLGEPPTFFLEENMSDNFLNNNALGMILSSLGWEYSGDLIDYVKEVNTYKGEIPTRADFCPEGVRLASSKKAIIICDGKTTIQYKDTIYYTPWMIFECHGQEALDDIDNWVFTEEKQWLIKKINGEWVRPFTLLTECPFRTTVRC